MSKKVDYEDVLHIDNFPECGPCGPSIEDLYQAFKERFIIETNLVEDSSQDKRSEGLKQYK